MKKILAFIAALAAGSALFAAEVYTVKSVKGKVTYEASAGRFKDVSVGQKLPEAAVINTGVNSTLVLSVDGKDVTVRPMSKGTVSSLVSGNGPAAAFKKNPTSSSRAVAAAADKTGKGIGTASERSSGKGEDSIEIDE